eukprot:569556-Pelagomonas_calceolata.AAC.2
MAAAVAAAATLHNPLSSKGSKGGHGRPCTKGRGASKRASTSKRARPSKCARPRRGEHASEEEEGRGERGRQLQQ